MMKSSEARASPNFTLLSVGRLQRRGGLQGQRGRRSRLRHGQRPLVRTEAVRLPQLPMRHGQRRLRWQGRLR